MQSADTKWDQYLVLRPDGQRKRRGADMDEKSDGSTGVGSTGAEPPGFEQPGGKRVEVIFSEDRIAERLDELARDISARAIERPLVIAILKGSFVFAADLIRAMHRHGLTPEIDFLTLSSYRRGQQSSGQVAILRDVDLDVGNRNIILIDDILESGRTLAFAKDLLAARGAASVLTCVLLEKNVPRAVNVEADFCAFACPPVFVVGYGMDVSHRYRELPFVGHVAQR
jgi:hypoxanthine phosphoribosyltransferase